LCVRTTFTLIAKVPGNIRARLHVPVLSHAHVPGVSAAPSSLTHSGDGAQGEYQDEHGHGGTRAVGSAGDGNYDGRRVRSSTPPAGYCVTLNGVKVDTALTEQAAHRFVEVGAGVHVLRWSQDC
jgi:hypothetical protein